MSAQIDHPLLSPSAEQVALVEAVWSGRQPNGDWPIFHYVTRVLERQGLDAVEVASKMPSELGHAWYTFIWSKTHGTVPQSADPVQLTLAGIACLSSSEGYVEDFLNVVRRMAARSRSRPISPTEIDEDRINTGQLIGLIDPDAVSIDLDRLVVARGLLEHEPATWGGQVDGTGDSWTYRLPANIGRYDGVTDLDDYFRVSFGLRPKPADDLEQLVPESPEPVTETWQSEWCDPGLWDQIGRLVEIEDWDAVTQKTSVYLERQLRSLGQRNRKDVGVHLVRSVLHTSGSHPLSDDETEAGGWFQLGLGFFSAVRNSANHGFSTDVSARYAFGVVGTASVLLTQMAVTYPRSLDPS